MYLKYLYTVKERLFIFEFISIFTVWNSKKVECGKIGNILSNVGRNTDWPVCTGEFRILKVECCE